MGDQKAPVAFIATVARDQSRFNAYRAHINPHWLMTKTELGRRLGMKVFDEMKADHTVFTALLRIEQAVRRHPWEIEPADESAQAREVAAFIRNELKGFYYQFVGNFLDAIPVGFSVTEFIVAAGDGRLHLAAVEKRKQDRFVFNERGELLLTSDGQKTVMPSEQFIVATFGREDEDNYGNPLLSKAFWLWWFKREVLLMWVGALEKFGRPLPIGKFPSGATEGEQTKFLNSLASVYENFAAVIPDAWTVDFAEVRSAANDGGYESFERLCDRKIEQLLTGAQVDDAGEAYGSRAATSARYEVSQDYLGIVVDFISQPFSALIRRLVEWNYGSDVAIPLLVVNYRKKGISPEEATTWKTLGEAGMPLPIDVLYPRMGLIPPTADTMVLYRGRYIRMGDIPAINARLDQMTIPAASMAAGDGESTAAGGNGLTATAVLYDYILRRVAPALVEKRSKYLLGVLRQINSIGDLRRLQIGDFHTPGAAGDWQNILVLARLAAEADIDAQLIRMQSIPFAAGDIDDAWTRLAPDEAIAWFRNRIAVRSDVWDALEAAAKQAGFYVSGLEDAQLINSVKDLMIQALADGQPFEQFWRDICTETGIRPLFNNAGTAFQTNLHNAVMAQDWKALERVKDVVQYRIYSTVGDGRTRAEHAEWDRFVAPATHPIWRWIFSHLLRDFNCRCRVVAATEDDYRQYRAHSNALLGKVDLSVDLPDPTTQDIDKLKALMQQRKGYEDILSGKLLSWEENLRRLGGKI